MSDTFLKIVQCLMGVSILVLLFWYMWLIYPLFY